MLSGCADGLPSKVADVDRACLEKRPQHMQATIPEGNRQHTAAGLLIDAALIGAAWPFNVSTDLGPELARAVHVWQVGPGNKQACCLCSVGGLLGALLGRRRAVHGCCVPQRCVALQCNH